MGLVIAREGIDAVRGEIGSLLAAHWYEVGQDKVRMKLDPDWDGYVALEKCDQLYVFTAREEATLAGYAVFIVRNHLHYRTIKMAINDLLFLLPAYRKGMAGMRLIRGCEQLLTDAGAKKIFFGVKAWLDFGPLLKRRGYAVAETGWTKWVGD